MNSLEKSGKTVDEAVQSALDEMGLDRDEVKIEVLEEGRKGLFLGFGSKDAKVRVTALEKSVVETTEEAPVEVNKEAPVKQETSASVSENVIEAVEEKIEAVRAEVTEEKEIIEETVQETVNDIKSDAVKAKEEIREFAVNDESVDNVKDFLNKVFDAMQLDVAIEKFIDKEEGSVEFKLHGEHMGILIGKHGQTLDALQYLGNLVANRDSEKRMHVIVDVENYRGRRAQTLNRLAKRLAEKVKNTGERVVLEPMNPHERKIIHTALQNDKEVTTISEGSDPYRRVVIKLKK